MIFVNLITKSRSLFTIPIILLGCLGFSIQTPLLATASESTPAADQNKNLQLNRDLDQMLGLINQVKQQNGIHVLQINYNLEKTSNYFAKFLAKNDRGGEHLIHIEQSGDNVGRGPYERCRYFGYNLTCGENLVAGQTDVQQAFDELMASFDHRRNILNPKYCQIGLGKAVNSESFYEVYWVQNFGRNC